MCGWRLKTAECDLDESSDCSRFCAWRGFVSLPPLWEGIPAHPCLLLAGKNETPRLKIANWEGRDTRSHLELSNSPHSSTDRSESDSDSASAQLWLLRTRPGAIRGFARPSRRQHGNGQHRAPLRTGVLPVRLPPAARTAFAAVSSKRADKANKLQAACRREVFRLTAETG